MTCYALLNRLAGLRLVVLKWQCQSSLQERVAELLRDRTAILFGSNYG